MAWLLANVDKGMLAKTLLAAAGSFKTPFRNAHDADKLFKATLQFLRHLEARRPNSPLGARHCPKRATA
jgi:hypothetical protein